jgi:hypothetical protein
VAPSVFAVQAPSFSYDAFGQQRPAWVPCVCTKNDVHPSAWPQKSRHAVTAVASKTASRPSVATRTPLLPVVEPYFQSVEAAAAAGSVEAASAGMIHATDSWSTKSSSKTHCPHCVAQRRYIASGGCAWCAWVGAVVGASVGALVGAGVGRFVGLAVVGANVGAAVGTLVGALVGANVGAGVGVGVGAGVGRFVGAG